MTRRYGRTPIAQRRNLARYTTKRIQWKTGKKGRSTEYRYATTQRRRHAHPQRTSTAIIDQGRDVSQPSPAKRHRIAPLTIHYGQFINQAKTLLALLFSIIDCTPQQKQNHIRADEHPIPAEPKTLRGYGDRSKSKRHTSRNRSYRHE